MYFSFPTMCLHKVLSYWRLEIAAPSEINRINDKRKILQMKLVKQPAVCRRSVNPIQQYLADS
jgi:hypothetical protein